MITITSTVIMARLALTNLYTVFVKEGAEYKCDE